jgi:glucose/arabinose dehydrogenase
MRRFLWPLLLGLVVASTTHAALPKPLVTGLKNPESVAVGADGRIYVTVIGEFDTDGDGGVMVIKDGKALPFARGMDDPKGLVAFQGFLYCTDKTRVWRIDLRGKATVLAAAKAFPAPPKFLNDIAVDEQGTLYVSDSGDLDGHDGAIFRITQQGRVSLVADSKKSPVLKTPNGLLMDSLMHLLVLDSHTGELHRLTIANGATEKVADGFGFADGLTFDHHGRLYITDHKAGKVFVIARPGERPVLLAEGFESAADLCLDRSGKNLLVPDMKAGTITAIPARPPGFEVDDSPLPFETEVAFPDLKWTGWKGPDSGKIVPLRPILLTHAGDGSNRVFVPTQHGVIHVFPNDQKAKETKVFLDIQDRVYYNDNQNEEGFLGLAFHPKFKENGEFFVFYTVKTPKLTNVVSRFRVKKDNPNEADPASEEELLRQTWPFWNHDGGTICFGPDGYLYITFGDGGDANDPSDNGQNLKVLFGKVLRIDVDHKDPGKKYAIPKDNPFVDHKDARPEIWCYGLRNIWRMAFDKKTKVLWGADVGQNLWEEINLLVAGGNYGWSRREGLHPFGPKGTGPRKEFIEPIWEYHHDIGKSCTGGCVYRGKRLPELDGYYLHADYVTGKIWALRYDETKKRVTENRSIRDRGLPIMSFGEDEEGDVYLMTYTTTGQGLFRFARSAKPK